MLEECHCARGFDNPPYPLVLLQPSFSISHSEKKLVKHIDRRIQLHFCSPIYRYFVEISIERNSFFFFGKLHVHFVNLKPNTSSSTLLLQEKQMPFELELICNNLVSYLNFLLIHGTGQIFTPNFLHPITHTKELCNNLCESRVHSIHSLRENAVNFITLPQRTKDTKVPSCKILTQDSA